MSIKSWMENNRSKYPDKQSLIDAVVKIQKCSKRSAQDAYYQIHSHIPKPKFTGLSEKELRARHDNMFKIREGCRKLPKGQYLTDQQMREFCNVPSNVWRGFSENLEFDRYKLRVDNKNTYWGTPEGVEKLREDLNV